MGCYWQDLPLKVVSLCDDGHESSDHVEVATWGEEGGYIGVLVSDGPSYLSDTNVWLIVRGRIVEDSLIMFRPNRCLYVVLVSTLRRESSPCAATQPCSVRIVVWVHFCYWGVFV